MDAKFRQDDSVSPFDLTKIRERFDEISWRNFVEFSREQRMKNTEFRLHFFYTVLYVQFFVLIGQKLTGEFVWKIYAASCPLKLVY